MTKKLIEKKGSKRKENKKDDTKNLLINFRSFFTDYIKSQDETAAQDPFIVDLENRKSVNRSDYEELFKILRYKPIISQMF